MDKMSIVFIVQLCCIGVCTVTFGKAGFWGSITGCVIVLYMTANGYM